jgi:8-oxo-dGTP diphosphatase
MAFCYDYPRPAVTVDCVIICKELGVNWLLLVQRKGPPFKHKWALPGGFIEMGEKLIQAAERELQEETGLTDVPLEQLKAFDKPDRDPRGRTITFSFYGNAGDKRISVREGSDAEDVGWFDLEKLPPLAFDHDEIIDYARKNKNI